MKTILSTVFLPVMTASILSLFSVSSLANGQPPKEPPSFDQMDSNGDEVLTKDELKGPLLDDFERFDIDGSGSLTKNELPEPPNH
ncbi:EF-hand domain-containing protein [Marinomonas colpomeniae]|uniref:EF-hand domain-containing protein n=1 Tax=Marinomonas colpomeniae TaxID=2774408 RepID=A0ABR8P2G2_9GAMM|nr:hypothetical protein [Marinomonas colpomeniae]MBD5772474.1 hypothetical protein [Marinomonas colpomeniae]